MLIHSMWPAAQVQLFWVVCKALSLLCKKEYFKNKPVGYWSVKKDELMLKKSTL